MVMGVNAQRWKEQASAARSSSRAIRKLTVETRYLSKFVKHFSIRSLLMFT